MRIATREQWRVLRSITVLVLAVSLFACRQLEPLPEPENHEPELPFYDPNIQLDKRHLQVMAKVIRSIPMCRLLVWGVGYDSRFWCAVNQGGTTFIIEDTDKWAKMTTKQIPCRVILADYETTLTQADELLKDSRRLMLELPPDIAKMTFDVIVVDAPDGSHPGAAGRMKSIYMSSILSHEHSHVFVDDYQRKVERKYSDRFLNTKFGPPVVYMERMWLAHFSDAL